MAGFKMSMFLIILSSCCVKHGNGTPDEEIMNEGFATLCPGVDICRTNATSPMLQPNEIIGRHTTISCCRGCSCHPDCTSNCCYRNESILPTCTRMYIESSPTTLSANVPAFYTVSTEPKMGCVDTQPFTTHLGDVKVPTCDLNPVARWGNLFPVLSKSSKQIYKNELCARCHGIHDAVPFTAYAVCESGKAISRSLQIFESAELSPFCRVEFRHNDVSLLPNVRCFVNAMSTCIQDEFPPLEGTNMSIHMIKRACEEGYFAPVVVEDVVYKNAFCTHCSRVGPYASCTKEDIDSKLVDYSKLTLLLEPECMQLPKLPASRTDNSHYPMACIKNNNTWLEETCRRVLCPSGMARNNLGICVYTTEYWMTNGVFVDVILTLVDGNRSQIPTDPKSSEALMADCPWPDDWARGALFIKVQDGLSNNDGVLFLQLRPTFHTHSTESFVKSVQDNLSKPWVSDNNGYRLHFTQSLMQYETTFKSLIARIPVWRRFIGTGNDTKYKDAMSDVWRPVISKRDNTRPTTGIDKLLFCDQVDLRKGEYVSEVDNYLITNTLTDGLLFDKEFVMVKDDLGGTVARVCLSDTPFVIRVPNSGGKVYLRNITLKGMIVYLAANAVIIRF